jgi:hypothetical protein
MDKSRRDEMLEIATRLMVAHLQAGYMAETKSSDVFVHAARGLMDRVNKVIGEEGNWSLSIDDENDIDTIR